MARGSIRKRQSGQGTRYDVIVDLGPDPVTGKRRQRSKSFTTRKEAQAHLTRWLSEIDAGTAIEQTTQTVRELLYDWLENDARQRIRATTYKHYEHIVRYHLLPGLGHIRAQTLTPAAIQQFYVSLARRGVKAHTVRACHAHLRQAYSMAVRLGLAVRNPTDGVRPPRLERPTIKPWTVEEAQQFLSVARSSPYAPYWDVLLLTGMRKGEALGLRWQDIDWSEGIIHVRQTVTMVQNRMTVWPTKTQNAIRDIPIDADLLDLLRQQRKVQTERRLKARDWDDRDLVFTTGRGTPIWHTALRRDLQALCQKAGVRPLHVHALRHTAATIAIEAGADIKAVSEQLGHADIAITLGTYAHVTPRQRRGVSTRIAQALRPTEGPHDAADGLV